MKSLFRTAGRMRLAPTDVVVLLLVTAIVGLSVLPYGSEQIWFEAIFCALIFLTAIATVLQKGTFAIDRHLKKIILPVLILAFFAFFQGLGGLIFLSTGDGVFAIDSFQSMWAGFKILSAVTFFLILATSFRRNSSPLVWILVVTGLFFTAFGLFRYFFQIALPWQFEYFIFPALKPGVGFATFLNQNHFAFLMLMTLGLSLSLVVSGKLSLMIRLLLLACSCLTWTAIVLTGSRAGILGSFLVVAASVLQIFQRPSKKGEKRIPITARIALFGVLAIVLATGVAFIGQDRVVNRFGELTEQLEETNSKRGYRRIEVYPATLEIIKNQPIFGVGFGSFKFAVSEHIDISGIVVPEQAHNDYLEYVASGGIVAVILGLWFLAAFLKLTFQRVTTSKRGFSAAARTGALCALAGAAFHSFFDFGLQMFSNQLFFVALVFLAVYDYKHPRNSNGRKLRGIIRTPLPVILLVVCLLLAGVSLFFGYSRHTLFRADIYRQHDSNGLPILPYDAESYRVLSNLDKAIGNMPAAISNLNQAIALRSRDYELWLQLGDFQENEKMYQKALGSYRKAAALAPGYSRPAHRLGLLLHKLNQKTEAYEKLKFAHRRDPRLFSKTVELAIQDSGDSSQELINLLSPMNTPELLMLGMSLYERERYPAIADLLCSSESANPSLIEAFVTRLIEKRQYLNAYRVLQERCGSETFDSDFENGDFGSGEINEGIGFGWRADDDREGVEIQIEKSDSARNDSHLVINFSGASDPSAPLVSQLIVVRPNTDYRISFLYKTKDYISGGLPLASIAMRGPKGSGNVASAELSTENNEWTRVVIPIRSNQDTEVLDFRLKRQRCESEKCPAFGTLLVDDFRLSK